jgi:hypothetical protein
VPCQEIFLVWHKKIRAIADTDSYSSILSVRGIRLITYRVVLPTLLFSMLRFLVFQLTTKRLRSLRVYIHLF